MESTRVQLPAVGGASCWKRGAPIARLCHLNSLWDNTRVAGFSCLSCRKLALRVISVTTPSSEKAKGAQPQPRSHNILSRRREFNLFLDRPKGAYTVARTKNLYAAAPWFQIRHSGMKVLLFIDSKIDMKKVRKPRSVFLNPSGYLCLKTAIFLLASPKGASTSVGFLRRRYWSHILDQLVCY